MIKDKQKEKMQLLSKENIWFHLTMDSWSLDSSMQAFGVTAHYIENWKLISANLDIMKVTEAETAENIINMLKSILYQHQIPEIRIASVTSDHASNMLAALNFTSWNTVGCFAHMVNLAVSDGLKLIPNQVKKLSQCIKYIRKSPSAFRTLSVPPVKYVQTRWCSFGKSISWICDHHLAVNSLLSSRLSSRGRLNIEPFHDDEIQLFQELRSPFELLNNFLTSIQGEKYITISMAFPYLRELHEALLPSPQNCMSTTYNAVKVAIRASIERRWDMKRLLEKNFITCAILLDPRIKTMEEEEYNIASKLYQDVLKEMSELSRPPVELPTPHRSSLEDLIERRLQSKRCPANDIDELTKYLNQDLIPLRDDPLMWWKANEKSFPKHSQMAKKYLACMASSAPVERLWSAAGRTMSKLRRKLKFESLQQILRISSSINNPEDVEVFLKEILEKSREHGTVDSPRTSHKPHRLAIGQLPPQDYPVVSTLFFFDVAVIDTAGIKEP